MEYNRMPSNTKKPISTSKSKNLKVIELGILEDVLGFHLRRAQSANFRQFSKHLGHRNVSPGQLGLLYKIKYNPGINQTTLAKAEGVVRSTLGEVIDRFEERKLVERRRDESDRRAYALHLTKNGENFLTEITPELYSAEQELGKKLTKKEQNKLLNLLRKLTANKS